MNTSKCRIVLIGLILALVIAIPGFAQTVRDNDNTILKQIIIYGRHSIRSSTVQPDVLAKFSSNTYPPFTGVPVGYLTPNGQKAARLMGGYFNEYLANQGLLTGNTATDLPRLYFRANSIQRSNVTAAFFGAGLIPGATVPVHSYALGTPDPVFDPIGAKVATMDPERAQLAAQGVYGNGEGLTSAYSGERALIRGVLAPAGEIDPTVLPFTIVARKTITQTGGAIDTGGLNQMNGATDPFVMQYADGFAPDDVGWGRFTLDTLSQETRLAVLQLGIAMRTPYINQVQSSNGASHVLRSMGQIVTGTTLPGAFGNYKSQILTIISSDDFVTGLASLLDLHWNLPGYQPDFCAPGGALVFELRQVKKTGGYVVRIYYTAQTFAQLRGLTELSLDVPPATMQLMVPGGSNSATDLDVPWPTFKTLMTNAINLKNVQNYWKEVPPGVLNNVPLN